LICDLNIMIQEYIIALIFSTAGSFFTATGLLLIKIANIQVEQDRKKKVFY